MKALLCRELGALEDLAVADLPSPHAGPGQVVIQVKAAAANFPDVLMVQGRYPFKPPMPFAPGCELAGIVKVVGEFSKREASAHRDNTRWLMAWVASGALRPLISARYPLSRAAEALQAVRDRKVTGNVLVLPEA